MPPKSSKAAPPRRRKQATRTGPRYARSFTTSPPSSSSTPPPHLSTPSSAHIRPLHLQFGNPSIHSLLIDDNAITRYQGFKDRPFVPIYTLTSSFLESLHIAKLHEFLSVQPMTNFLLNNTDHIFPGMVGQFFANLRFENSYFRNVIINCVNKVNIRLNSDYLNHIFGTTLDDSVSTLRYWDDSHLWPETGPLFSIAALRSMFHVQSREAKDFNPTNLTPVDRVIYHILVNFINPVAGHFTTPGKMPLVYYYFFTHNTPIDWGFLVFNRLADLITDSRRNLPNAQFFTPIFRHFKIPFTEAGIPPPSFDISILTKKGIRLHHGHWIIRQAYLSMTQPPSSSPPPSSISQSSSTSLLEGLNKL